MVRKKKLIWWESEPIVTGAGQARTRGAQDESGPRGTSHSPFYGPVTIPWDSDPDEDTIGIVTG